MLTKTSTLFVAWQAPKGRSITPVGRLDGRAGSYTFEYIAGALSAHELGFPGFFEFPAFAARYTSDVLFPLFQNRLMPTARPDFSEHIGALGLDPATADPLCVLARSGGTRATDRVELFAPPVYDPERRLWETFFLLRGIRHRPPSAQDRVLSLSPQERLFAMLDLHNAYNPRALLLRTQDGYNVGYLPDYMVEDVASLVDRPQQLEIFVERLNLPPLPVHHRVLCRLVASWGADYMPYGSTTYQSLAGNPQAQQLDEQLTTPASAAE